MATPTLKPGQRLFIQVSSSGAILGTATIHIGKHAPRGPNGYWRDITDCVTCCSSSTSTTTTTSP